MFNWSGQALAYTHSCMGTIFSSIDPMTAKGEREELKNVFMPASLWFYMTGEREDLPHLEYYLGETNAQNPLKTLVKEFLKSIGSIHESECITCRAREQNK